MEKNSNKGLKKLVLLLLLFVGLGASVTAGAYWASRFTVTLPSDTGTVKVNVGEGKEVIVSTSLSAATSGDNKVLVPADFVVDTSTQTATKEFTVTATWSRTDTFAGIDLDDITENYKIVVGDYVIKYTGTETSLDQDAYALFSVDIAFTVSEAIELGGENIITVTVTMAEPDNVEIYNKVADKDITITFSLNVVVSGE